MADEDFADDIRPADDGGDDADAAPADPTDPAAAADDPDPAAAAAAAVVDGGGVNGGDSDVENDPTKPTTPPGVPLTPDVVAQHLSVLARTGNGLSFAYTRLEVRGRNIGNIDLLEGFVHLRFLDMSDNAITSIDALAFMEYLLAIDFHSNRLRRIPASLDRRKYLQQVNFAKNRLVSVDVANWPMVAWLNVNDNLLSSLKLQEFGELLHLEARGNRIEHTRGINARKLQKLYLAANKLTAIELEDTPNLQILHLRENQINSLSGFNESLKALHYLNLRNNAVESIDEVEKLAALPCLKTLVLSENPVEQIPNYRLEVIKRLPKLEKLDKEAVSDEEREEAAQLQQASADE
ncbi:hypothetical protein DFJ73DRAFT_956341 [Zopfochytrium polystomum]|nr:hypothetical protein DFJ73DRAFT_956341 [Zopfochytrium polystomum]